MSDRVLGVQSSVIVGETLYLAIPERDEIRMFAP